MLATNHKEDTNTGSAPERKSSLDLLKILAMVFIMTAHFMGWGGAVNTLTPHDVNYYWVMPLYFVSQIGNTLFFMVTGYFARLNGPQKVIYLERKTAFYSVLITLIAFFLGSCTIWSVAKSFFPIVINSFWFISVYLILLLIGRLLLPGMKSLTKNGYLIVLLAVLFNNALLSSANYTLLQGLLAFLTGHYLRRFGSGISKWRALGFFVFMMFLYAAERLIVIKADIEHSRLDEAFRCVLLYFAAVALFTYFERLSIRSSFFSSLTKNTVAVYLISAHPKLRNALYLDVLHISEFCLSAWFILYYLAFNAALFAFCILVDKAVSKLNRAEADFWVKWFYKLKVRRAGSELE